MKKYVLSLFIILTAINTVGADQIVLNPTGTSCFFIWKINYSDGSALTVGDDYIQIGGITMHVSSSDVVEFDILHWNPSAKSVDGDIVITFQVVSNEPATFSTTIEGLTASNYYTILKDKNVFIVVIADEQGRIQFSGSTESSHIYDIVTGYHPAAIVTTETVEEIIVAVEEKSLTEKLFEKISCFWWLLILVLVVVAIYIKLRSH